MSDYIHMCKAIVDELDPELSQQQFRDALCQRLRLYRGHTKIVRDLLMHDVEIWCETSELVPGWFRREGE